MSEPGRAARAARLAAVVMLVTGVAAAQGPPGLGLPGAEVLAPGVTMRLLEGPRASEPVDETGLRFYVSTGDLAAAEAELLRLRARHPGWSPPADLMRNPWGGADEEPIWARIRAGRIAEARQAADLLQADRPEWRPSPAMLREMERGELRERLARWQGSGDWAAIRIALEGKPEARDCSTADLAWYFAEASARVNLPGDAAAVFRGLVDTCVDFNIRLASLQKASGLLAWDRVDELFRLEAGHRRNADQQRRFLAAQTTYRHAQLADLANGRSQAPSAAMIASLERSVEGSRDVQGAVLLGWWHYHAKRFAVATQWFERGVAWGAQHRATND